MHVWALTSRKGCSQAARLPDLTVGVVLVGVRGEGGAPNGFHTGASIIQTICSLTNLRESQGIKLGDDQALPRI